MVSRWLWFFSVLIGIYLFESRVSVYLVIILAILSWLFRKKKYIALYTRIGVFGTSLAILSYTLSTWNKPLLGDSCYGYVSNEFSRGYAVSVFKCDTAKVNHGVVYVNCYGRGCPGMYTKVYIKVNSIDSFGNFDASGALISRYSVEEKGSLLGELSLKALILGNKYKMSFYKHLLAISNEEISSLGTSIIVGETEFPNDLKDIVLDLGLMHIVAISGVNILYLQKLVETLTKKQGIKMKRLTELVTMISLWVFVGNEFSLLRAMGSVVWNVLAGEFGMVKNKFDFLFIFTILLVSDIKLVNSISFWLVFGACVGIYVVVPNVISRLKIKNDFVSEFISGVIVWLTVMPVVSYFFKRVQPLSIITSFVLAPLVEIITMLGYAVFALHNVPVFGEVAINIYVLVVSIFYNAIIVFHST